jgi:hypothetical protein
MYSYLPPSVVYYEYNIMRCIENVKQTIKEIEKNAARKRHGEDGGEVTAPN